MQTDPVIFLIADDAAESHRALGDTLRRRYQDGFRVATAEPVNALAHVLRLFREQREQIALFAVVQADGHQDVSALLDECLLMYPDARGLVITPDASIMASTGGMNPAIQYLEAPWTPPEQRLYPLLDELLAEWRASADMPFTQVKGIMTVRAVRIRLDDTLHRAAEVIALSGIGDLMVIDDDNRFIGVLSVGDVLRAAMPDIEEILEHGGTLDQAFRLFLRKGSELMYKPIAPLVIRDPLVVDPDDHVAKAAALMLQKNIHRLPVVKDGRLVGTVGRTDVCQAVVGTL
jgi:CBS domain-containing protein